MLKGLCQDIFDPCISSLKNGCLRQVAKTVSVLFIARKYLTQSKLDTFIETFSLFNDYGNWFIKQSVIYYS